MKWGLWSSIPANNSNTPPDGWPEGQAPSTVNDCARELMAQVKTGIKDIQFIDLGVTPTRTGNTTFTMSGDQTQWFGVGNRVKAFDAGALKYGWVHSCTFTTLTGVMLRLDNGAVLTASMSAVASGFPTAFNHGVPEMAFKSRNLLDNPNMDIWQRGDGPFGGSSTMVVRGPDRWKVEFNQTTTFACNVSRTAQSPPINDAGYLIGSSIAISISAANAVANSTNYFAIMQGVEGWDWKNIGQRPFTVSFWILSDETGTFCCAVRNSISDRSCVLDFAVSAAATWEKKTLTFPKSPAGGTWNYGAGIGITLCITMTSGSFYQATPGAWTSMNALATSSIGNFCRSAGNTMYITGFKLNEGASELPCEQRSYPEELLRCQRHVYALQNAGVNQSLCVASCFDNSTVQCVIPMATTMRAIPSISASTNALTLGTGGLFFALSGAPTNIRGSTNMWSGSYNVPVAAIATNSAELILSAGPRVVFKSEIT